MALILLRHTRPVGSEGVCYGVTDLPPGPDLQLEAARLAGELPEVASIVTSPLARAAHLASALRDLRDLPVVSDARLTEMDFGAWEGRPWDEIPREELDAWAADLMGARPHGGENVRMLGARVGEALASLGPEPTLLITHMGVIRAALAWASQPDPWDRKLNFGEWLCL